MTTPSTWQPQSPDEFIGVARRHGLELSKVRLPKIANNERGFLRCIFFGVPGCGKTELARVLAMQLAQHRLAIEHVNGQSVSVDLVREWSAQDAYRGMFGTGWKVKIIDEFDRMSQAAVFEMHTHLDRRTPLSAFFLTSNKDVEEMPEAFQTRANLYRFTPPTVDDVVGLLVNRFGLSKQAATTIAAVNKGNVRGALFDAERELDRIELERLEKAA